MLILLPLQNSSYFPTESRNISMCLFNLFSFLNMNDIFNDIFTAGHKATNDIQSIKTIYNK